MKKILAALLAGTMTLTLAGCAGSNTSSGNLNSNIVSQSQQSVPADETLVTSKPEESHVTSLSEETYVTNRAFYCIDVIGSYTGEWNNGKPHGKGVFTYATGTAEGQWENGVFYEGKKVYDDGQIEMGIFTSFELCDGKLTYTDGTYMEGKFSDRKIIYGIAKVPHGDGKFTVYNDFYEDGKITQGTVEFPRDDGIIALYDGDFGSDERLASRIATFTYPDGSKTVRNGTFGIIPTTGKWGPLDTTYDEYDSNGKLVKSGSYKNGVFYDNNR